MGPVLGQVRDKHFSDWLKIQYGKYTSHNGSHKIGKVQGQVGDNRSCIFVYYTSSVKSLKGFHSEESSIYNKTKLGHDKAEEASDNSTMKTERLIMVIQQIIKVYTNSMNSMTL